VPEILEVEAYRRAADQVVGRVIERVHAPDDWFVKGETTPELLRRVLPGNRISGTRRVGKLLLVDTDGPVLGLRFGMTGRIVVDGEAPIEALIYSGTGDDPAWDRFGMEFAEGGALVIRDPRRLGGVELDPDETRLGVDAASLTRARLGAVLAGSNTPLKARLLDQSRVAGLGNLLVDETLWRAGLAPGRPAGSLDADELARLARTVRRTLAVLGERGGSHTGDLQPARVRGGSCPRDGAELRRDQIGGRTTYWCSAHQR
jgi:formamidopyrimidine-DNA glycosylase